MINEIEEILEMRRTAPPEAMEQATSGLSGKPVVLYGAGAFGAENFALLSRYGVIPAAFLDKNAQPGAEKLGIPVYHPDSENLSGPFRKECSVYISITAPARVMSSIKSDLSNWGYENCKEVQSITARQVCYDDDDRENPGDDYMQTNKEKIIRALDLMADEESRKTYVSCVKAHLLREYCCVYETGFPEQYFDAGVPLKKGLSSFIDCGAYNGDSLIGALRHCGTIDNFIAFEPIVSNFIELSDAVAQRRDVVKSAFLYPCGVAERTGTARFNVAASASAITENDSGEVLPLVRLDDVIFNVPLTFIKMDIEGAELSALRGAERLISEQSPDMAISVYHCVNHFWDIPYYISRLSSRYSFYLRAHTAATLESVLYCCE